MSDRRVFGKVRFTEFTIWATRFCSSLRLTVVLLGFLAVLVTWGTVFQRFHGLFESKARFITSWFFLAGGVFPFPGGQLIMWLLTLNLVAAFFTCFAFRRDKLGIWLIHIGLAVMCLASFWTYAFSLESRMVLTEGQGSNLSSLDRQWEISVWVGEGSRRSVEAFTTTDGLDRGAILEPESGICSLEVLDYYRNCRAVISSGDIPPQPEFINGSGIVRLEPSFPESDSIRNVPGVRLRVSYGDGGVARVLLYGGESEPTGIQAEGSEFFLALRGKRHQLPFTVRLVDVERELHPGTEIAKSYESTVELMGDGWSREAVISMNNPLPVMGHTLFQSGYAVDRLGRETTTLAVVKNSGRLLPYVASFVTGLGLILHFFLMPLLVSRSGRQQ